MSRAGLLTVLKDDNSQAVLSSSPSWLRMPLFHDGNRDLTNLSGTNLNIDALHRWPGGQRMGKYAISSVEDAKLEKPAVAGFFIFGFTKADSNPNQSLTM